MTVCNHVNPLKPGEAGSAILGRRWMGAGVSIEALQPIWFWNFVKFQLGVGGVFLIIGLLKGKGPT
jgi:hypothetical protein